MPTLGKTSYYKTSTNGVTTYSTSPWAGNIPYGYTQLSKEEYIQGLQSKMKEGQDFMNTYDSSVPYAIVPKDKTGWSGRNYVGATYKQSDIDQYKKEIDNVKNGTGIYSDEYVYPEFSKFQPNAPTPSEEYYTAEYRSTLPPSEQARLNKQYGQNNPITPAPAGKKEVKVGNGYAFISTDAPESGKTNASEIARAQQVWADAEKLAGTGKYVGQTAQQIRDAAHAYAESLRNGQTNFDNQGGTTPTDPAKPTDPTTPEKPSTQSTGNVKLDASLKIINDSDLPEAIKALYRTAVQTWDPSKSIDAKNIIDKFKSISATTIDPYYKELASTVADEYTRSYNSAETLNKNSLEAQNANAKQNIAATQEDLARRGMTFSGEGVKALGAESAYAQPENANAAIPTQTAPVEGQIIQANRLVASSQAERYRKAREDLSRAAENSLGSDGVGGLPGISARGGVTGTINNQKQKDYASTLQNLIDQQAYNSSTKKPLNLNV